MPRCQSCAKFVEVNAEGEPEVDVDAKFDEDGNVSVEGSVRITNDCAECSELLQEATFDVSLVIDVEHAEGCAHDGDPDLDFDAERFDEFIPPKAKRQKHMYGASATVKVTCDCGAKGELEWKETIQSSHMDAQ